MFKKIVKNNEEIIFPNATSAFEVSQRRLKEAQKIIFEKDKQTVMKEIIKSIKRGDVLCWINKDLMSKEIISFLRKEGYQIADKTYLDPPMGNYYVVSWYKEEVEDGKQ